MAAMRRILFAATSALLLFGCSSSSSGSSPGDSGGDTIGDPNNCVPPGSKPNERGMGGYCSPGGGQCLYAGPDGGARICTADVPDTPAHAWFCTYVCNVDGDCGTDAYCATDPKTKQKGCVPTVCKKLQGDAGTDSASETSTADTSSGDATD